MQSAALDCVLSVWGVKSCWAYLRAPSCNAQVAVPSVEHKPCNVLSVELSCCDSGHFTSHHCPSVHLIFITVFSIYCFYCFVCLVYEFFEVGTLTKARRRQILILIGEKTTKISQEHHFGQNLRKIRNQYAVLLWATSKISSRNRRNILCTAFYWSLGQICFYLFGLGKIHISFC